MPDAQDPLGLTRAQWQADPQQASPLALAFDTRKSTRQNQVGLQWNKDFDSTWSTTAAAWVGQRSVQQFQAIPVATQAAASSPAASSTSTATTAASTPRARQLRRLEFVLGLAWECWTKTARL